MDYSVRSAKTEDIEVIQDLTVELSEKEKEEFDPTIDPEWNTTGEAEDYLEGKLGEDGFAVIAEDDENIIGYAIGSVRGAEDYRGDIEIAELESMYVKSEYRSRGIGTEFMEEFEQWANESNADRLRVEVTSQNEDGIRFYENRGLEDYARIMEKDL